MLYTQHHVTGTLLTGLPSRPMRSPTPSASASIASTVSYARSPSPGISQPSLLDDQANMKDRILRAERTELDNQSLVELGKELVQSHGRPDSEEVRAAAEHSTRGSPVSASTIDTAAFARDLMQSVLGCCCDAAERKYAEPNAHRPPLAAWRNLKTFHY